MNLAEVVLANGVWIWRKMFSDLGHLETCCSCRILIFKCLNTLNTKVGWDIVSIPKRPSRWLIHPQVPLHSSAALEHSGLVCQQGYTVETNDIGYSSSKAICLPSTVHPPLAPIHILVREDQVTLYPRLKNTSYTLMNLLHSFYPCLSGWDGEPRDHD